MRAAELAGVAADAELASARGALAAADLARAELARSEQHLGVLVRDRRLHDELDRAFTDLRTDLNQALRPEISELASRYIRELTDGRYSEIELDDQYNVIVLEDAIPKPVISGGEEDLANLVLRLSISEMIAERAGQAFSLLILDEVFGSLDETRRHNVVDLLRRLQDRFEQVILITHIESVREGLDHVVTVHYDEESGISRVEAEQRTDVAVDRRSGRRGGLMAVSRSWRQHQVDGPYRARVDDIAELNQVFSDAFTERYRRDGMVGVRVPFLNPAIWRYAIDDAADGAMLWRDDRGRLAAFNMVHRSGDEGWMGPLAVRTEAQGGGTGKEIVGRGIDWLKSQNGGARVIGLETMPRTMDNIGFYSRLGFIPGRLTVTTTLDAVYSEAPARRHRTDVHSSARRRDRRVPRARAAVVAWLRLYARDHADARTVRLATRCYCTNAMNCSDLR